MDESGAVGLDLSMANWVFLMEPLADRSLEEQIVSRAHRMGALDPINVEVVVMRDSAEEHLMKLCKEGVSGEWIFEPVNGMNSEYNASFWQGFPDLTLWGKLKKATFEYCQSRVYINMKH